MDVQAPLGHAAVATLVQAGGAGSTRAGRAELSAVAGTGSEDDVLRQARQLHAARRALIATDPANADVCGAVVDLLEGWVRRLAGG